MKEKIHHPKACQDILSLLQAEKIEEVFHYLELYRNSLCEEVLSGKLAEAPSVRLDETFNPVE